MDTDATSDISARVSVSPAAYSESDKKLSKNLKDSFSFSSFSGMKSLAP